jgi:hypothetical protein
LYVNDPAPPNSPELEVEEFSVMAHWAAAAVTAKVWPAIVIVPVSGKAEVLAVTVKLTFAGPFADAPPVTVMKLALDCAVQGQPDAVTTPTALVPPAAGVDADEDRSV